MQNVSNVISSMLWKKTGPWQNMLKKNRYGNIPRWPCHGRTLKRTNSFKKYVRFKRTLFIRTKTQSANCRGNPPLSSYKTTLKQQSNGKKTMKNERKKMFGSCFRTLAISHVSYFFPFKNSFPTSTTSLNFLFYADEAFVEEDKVDQTNQRPKKPCSLFCQCRKNTGQWITLETKSTYQCFGSRKRLTSTKYLPCTGIGEDRQSGFHHQRMKWKEGWAVNCASSLVLLCLYLTTCNFLYYIYILGRAEGGGSQEVYKLHYYARFSLGWTKMKPKKKRKKKRKKERKEKKRKKAYFYFYIIVIIKGTLLRRLNFSCAQRRLNEH